MDRSLVDISCRLNVNFQSYVGVFLLTNGTLQTIDCPGATFTFLSGIDPQGQMVGGYGTVDGNGHGALVKNGNCIAVDIAGGTNTYANGINPEGDIVGRYTGSDNI